MVGTWRVKIPYTPLSVEFSAVALRTDEKDLKNTQRNYRILFFINPLEIPKRI